MPTHFSRRIIVPRMRRRLACAIVLASVVAVLAGYTLLVTDSEVVDLTPAPIGRASALPRAGGVGFGDPGDRRCASPDAQLVIQLCGDEQLLSFAQATAASENYSTLIVRGPGLFNWADVEPLLRAPVAHVNLQEVSFSRVADAVMLFSATRANAVTLSECRIAGAPLCESLQVILALSHIDRVSFVSMEVDDQLLVSSLIGGNIKHLELWDCPVCGDFLQSPASKQLVSLSIRNCVDFEPEHLHLDGDYSLRHLTLYDIDCTVLASAPSTSQLLSLRLHSCPGVSADVWSKVRFNSNLHTLDVSAVEDNAPILIAAYALQHIESLSVAFTDKAPLVGALLPTGKKLETLIVRTGGVIAEALLRRVAECKMLRDLTLDGIFSIDITEALCALPSLEKLAVINRSPAPMASLRDFLVRADLCELELEQVGLTPADYDAVISMVPQLCRLRLSEAVITGAVAGRLLGAQRHPSRISLGRIDGDCVFQVPASSMVGMASSIVLLGSNYGQLTVIPSFVGNAGSLEHVEIHKMTINDSTLMALCAAGVGSLNLVDCRLGPSAPLVPEVARPLGRLSARSCPNIGLALRDMASWLTIGDIAVANDYSLTDSVVESMIEMRPNRITVTGRSAVRNVPDLTELATQSGVREFSVSFE